MKREIKSEGKIIFSGFVESFGVCTCAVAFANTCGNDAINEMTL
jgi:hypothetical protein